MNRGKSSNIFAHVCTCNDLGKCLTSFGIYKTENTRSLAAGYILLVFMHALHKLITTSFKPFPW